MSAPRVLLVDDDGGLVQAYCMLLTALGWRVEHETTCSGARCALERRCYDAVLVDLHLADGSGTEIIEDVVSTPRAGVCIVTSGDMGAMEEIAAAVPGASLLPKPFGAEDLLRHIDAHQ